MALKIGHTHTKWHKSNKFWGNHGWGHVQKGTKELKWLFKDKRKYCAGVITTPNQTNWKLLGSDTIIIIKKGTMKTQHFQLQDAKWVRIDTQIHNRCYNFGLWTEQIVHSLTSQNSARVQIALVSQMLMLHRSVTGPGHWWGK